MKFVLPFNVTIGITTGIEVHIEATPLDGEGLAELTIHTQTKGLQYITSPAFLAGDIWAKLGEQTKKAILNRIEHSVADALRAETRKVIDNDGLARPYGTAKDDDQQEDIPFGMQTPVKKDFDS